MSALVAIQKRGVVPASHQGSWAVQPRAEKVTSLVNGIGASVHCGQSVQPANFEVRRLEPAWIRASSNRPTSPTDTRTHVRATRIRARRVGKVEIRIGKHRKQVRRVRRLDRPSIHAGFSRLTLWTNLFKVRRN